MSQHADDLHIFIICRGSYVGEHIHRSSGFHIGCCTV